MEEKAKGEASLIYITQTQELLPHDEQIGDDGIRQDTFSVSEPYPENVSFADLYSHKGIEIRADVVEGLTRFNAL